MKLLAVGGRGARRWNQFKPLRAMFWIGLCCALTSVAIAQDYAGEAECNDCHRTSHQAWTESRHSKMLQPATSEAVKGDFSAGRVRLRGVDFVLTKRGGVFYITESFLTGKPREHRVQYTLGNRRIQHYLTTLPDGRIILLPPSWDVQRKRWFHNLDIDDPEEVPGVQVQLWNKSCYSCHVSQEEKQFDLKKITYKTKWLNFGVNCERCHGPGDEHVKNAKATPYLPWFDRNAPDIVNPARLSSERSTMVCAQCHSFRDIWVDGFRAGDNWYDHFLPVLEYGLPNAEDPAYWADGRTRRFSNDAFGLWQSQCYLKGGATCVTCHSAPHNTNIDANPQLHGNALCTQCHKQIGAAVTQHTHHAASGAGSQCIGCHMPPTVLSIKAQIRDHSMSIPVPENTIRHGVPNACNVCHKEQDANWALAQMNRWYGSKSREKLIRRAEAFSLAREGKIEAVPLLVAILSEPAEGPLTRANATGHLGQFQNDPVAREALLHALTDREPVVRTVAVVSLKVSVLRDVLASTVVPMLRDPVAIVRMGAAMTLVNAGVRQLPGADGEAFEQAKQVYRGRAELNSDDAEQQVASGKFYFLAGDFPTAAAAFRSSLRLDPTIPAQYYLALTYVQEGKNDEARVILQAIPTRDPQYARAQSLLRALSENTAAQH